MGFGPTGFAPRRNFIQRLVPMLCTVSPVIIVRPTRVISQKSMGLALHSSAGHD